MCSAGVVFMMNIQIRNEQLTAVLVTHRQYKNRPVKADFQKKSHFQGFNMFLKVLFLGFIGLCYTQFDYDDGYPIPIPIPIECGPGCKPAGKIHFEFFSPRYFCMLRYLMVKIVMFLLKLLNNFCRGWLYLFWLAR